MKTSKPWIAARHALWVGVFIVAAPAVAQTGGIDVCVLDEDSQPLLGAVTLEIFRLGVDPVSQRLIPVPGLLMRQRG